MTQGTGGGSDPPNDIDNFIQELDREEEQEQDVKEEKGSFFGEAPAEEILLRRAREYACVLAHPWRPACTRAAIPVQ